MARLKLAILAFCCCFSLALNAQTTTTQLDDAKIEMIRAAVVFYSTDTLVSKGRIACDAKTISELKTCAKSLAGVDKKIDLWNSIVVKDAADLKDLGTTIVNAVSKDKEYRKKLPGYQAFTNEIERLSAPADEVQTKPANDVPASGSAATPPANSPVTGNDDQVATTPVASQVSSPVEIAIWKDPFILSIVAIAIALTAFIIALMAKNRKPHRRSGSSHETPPVFQDYSSVGSQLNLVALEEKIARLSSELDSANEIIREMDRRLTGKVQQLEAKETDYAPRPEQVASATPFSANKKWAKNVDGGGFEMDALSSEPDSKMIYEITQTGPQTATFKVSETREAQLFALSNPQNYLREGCNYASQPSSNSQIRTEVPGTLELQGRKWRISNPAQITFL